MQGFKNRDILPIPRYTDVYKLLNPEDIFSYYVPNLVLNGVTNSPIGAIDKRASFSVFYNANKGKYMFKEFRYGYIGDCIDLVRYIFMYPNNTKACMKIFKDFGIKGFAIDENITESPFKLCHKKKVVKLPVKDRHINISVVRREWLDYDIKFWEDYGLNIEFLQLGNIYPIKYYYLNGNLRVADKYAYCYVEKKDEEVTYKIYQPFNKDKRKWINNNNSSIWELWNLLPKKHNMLLITKSRKDALSIIKNLKIPSVSLQSESTLPKKKVMEELKSRFERIILLYDNDYDKEVNWGLEYATKISKIYEIPIITIPAVYKSKDFTDLIKEYGLKKAINILLELINK